MEAWRGGVMENWRHGNGGVPVCHWSCAAMTNVGGFLLMDMARDSCERVHVDST